MKHVFDGSLLDAYMRNEGRKLSWVAAQLGVCEALVSRMKKGHVPKYDTLIRVAALLKVSVDSLFKSDGNAA